MMPQAPDLEDHRVCERRWIDNQPGTGQHVRAALLHAGPTQISGVLKAECCPRPISGI